MPEDEPLIAYLSAIEHYAYCSRQFALIHVECMYAENKFTLEGSANHERVDEPEWEVADGVRLERALPVWSEKYGLQGRADMIEFHPDGKIVPVEYKRGGKQAVASAAYQLVGQAICLEEMTGQPVTEGFVYGKKTRRRYPVNCGDVKLRNETLEMAEKIKQLIIDGYTPPPVNDERCEDCSLADICQPELVCHAKTVKDGELFKIE
jgi:CRISPR-associated exonuclease Cas4